MRQIDTDALKSEIRRGEVGGAYVIYGREDYLKNLSANRIISALVSEQARGFDYTEIFGELDIGRLRDLTMVLPMLSEKRVVLLRDPDIYETGAEHAADLGKLIKELPRECVLVFVFVSVPLSFEAPRNRSDKKVTRAKEIFADATAVSCDRLSGGKAVTWITAMLGKRGVSIERDVAAKLYELCGGDMYTIKNDTDILASSGGNAVTEDMLFFVTHATVEQDSFALSNAMADGDFDRVYALLSDLERRKVDPRELMPTVLSAFTAMYRVAVAKEEKGNYRVLEGSFGYQKNSYPLRMAASRVRGRTRRQLRRAVLLCADAERRLKRDFAGYEAYYELAGGLSALKA